MTRPTLHLVPESRWDAQDLGSPYVPERFAEEGFVHCTDGDDEMLRTANRFYRDDPQRYLVLTVDLDATGSPWRFDEPGRPYPHVYGPIDPASVIDVRRLARDPDGTFTTIIPR